MKTDDNNYYVYCHTLKKDNRKYIGISRLKPNLRWRKKGQGYKWRYIEEVMPCQK